MKKWGCSLEIYIKSETYRLLIEDLKGINLGVSRDLFDPLEIHLKRNRFDYPPLIRKGAHASRLYSRDWQKSSLQTEIRAFLYYYFFDCTLKDTLTAKSSGASS